MTATTMTMAATTASTSSMTMLTASEILRHGKQAGNDSKKSAPPPEPAQPAKTTSTKQSSPTKAQKRASRDGAAQQDKSGKSKNYREEAEKIVAQEKAQGEKMPKFEGLENYTLLEKMGDGAFSNVFKAMDNRAGRKVAVKVVRKYELNTTQVSSVPRPALHPR